MWSSAISYGHHRRYFRGPNSRFPRFFVLPQVIGSPRISYQRPYIFVTRRNETKWGDWAGARSAIRDPPPQVTPHQYASADTAVSIRSLTSSTIAITNLHIGTNSPRFISLKSSATCGRNFATPYVTPNKSIPRCHWIAPHAQ